ncbi:HEPN domain-containing protein [Aurantimonas sp. VKM B-3413]|uniref:HEPN domain-containing protein n=1 Tax=Aurantimonas sp. VKM B-3413 TaxID=2779401 RepID=UPI00351D5995
MPERQVFYHASISMDVAAWDSYINSVVTEFNSRIGGISNPSLLRYRANIQLTITKRLDKFNTPNFDNTRTLVVECTGFDPVSSWAWPARNMIWQAVQIRLNEILRIRHSFAHGFSLPNYSWLPQKGGVITHALGSPSFAVRG